MMEPLVRVSECARPRIEIVRVPSTERAGFRPLDGVQLRAAYSHVRVGTYCPEPQRPIAKPETGATRRTESKPPVELQARKYKKNLGPVSRLLRRRHHATSLATKSCDNIYSVNKTHSFFEWKHGHDQGRQSSSLDWRVGRSIDKINSSNLEYRKASRSAEHLSRSGTLQTSSTKSKIVSLLKRLSPRLPRPNGKGSLPSSPSICPWVQVEYTSNGVDARDGQSQPHTQLENDYSFQRELQLNEMRKRAIKANDSAKKEAASDARMVTKDKKSLRACSPPNVQIRDLNPNLRAAHEDRGSSEERRAAARPNSVSTTGAAADSSVGRREVAGLLNRPDSPGASLPRTSRRSRPHSLAVQPLNYQRLDPDQQLLREHQRQVLASDRVPPPPPRVNIVVAPGSGKRGPDPGGKHPSMTSQESIGSCSLDVEKSASDRSDVNAGSLSERTLHSLALSACNGHDSSLVISGAEPAIRVTQACGEHLASNGHGSAVEPTATEPTIVADNGSTEQLTRIDACTESCTSSSKKPSYLGLACSISGYSGITRYDSKLREGFRSRDSSPGARLIVRDTSPAGFRSQDPNQSLTAQPKSQSISPLAMDRQCNGLANGVRDAKCSSKYLDSRTASPYSSDGYSEVDRGIATGRDESILDPVHTSSPIRKVAGGAGSPVAARIASYNQQNNSFLSTSSPKCFNVSHTSHNSSSGVLNGSSSLDQDASLCILNASSGSEKSFIQQRVERLYGPGALAQGFYKRGGSPRTNGSKLAALNASYGVDKSIIGNNNHNNNNNDTSVVDEATLRDEEESLRSLPVLRHLRPEFRAQLPVVSPRRPTDGTEQVVKPLKRISISSQKTDTKENKENAVKQKNEPVTNGTKMSPSIVNDANQQQQPAVPEVVPATKSDVLSQNNGNARNDKPERSEDQEKDGHYYVNLLNREKSRLLAMSQQAQDELDSCTELGISEDVAGKLRSAIGKTGLLTGQRMHQFEGLCQLNINKVPHEQFPTTNEDLAGFWDMVMLQVDQIDGMYAGIEAMRKSGWQEVPDRPAVPELRSVPSTPQNGTSARRRQTPASKAKSSMNTEAARKAREAREQNRRQMLEERRRAMRANANKSTDNAIEIFAPET
ncbi:uncharacterized protein LOC106641967 [Copidosoma floridanum]|uniref:uncharacterized protein LOC106641967 n=1 Tax=Copidosoma floridanum TaxID=29053 RepID=UPI0006C97E75|nr:uncharacterized protein LOC106641967 [Copidosoma floridanum]XP_014212059.1 uncharacterized protein LOC106641967 [Copidosoma floridanum]XP_014212061.1 uncharacterized protein LOC106641967 [Copidosoma floridanum]